MLGAKLDDGPWDGPVDGLLDAGSDATGVPVTVGTGVGGSVGVAVGAGVGVGGRVGALVGGAGVVTPSEGAAVAAVLGAFEELGPTVTQPATRNSAAKATGNDFK